MWIYTFLKSIVFGHKTSIDYNDFIVFGLGNPGRRYFYTRHNIGYRIIDRFSSSFEKPKQITTEYTSIVKGSLRSLSVLAVKPSTFMNHSGLAVGDVLNKSKHSEKKTKFIIVVDDINLPFGTFRIRNKGTHGGHNGIKSIIDSIGTDFPRLRVGVGPLPESKGLIDFVLGNFSEQEESILPEVISKGNEILQLCAVEEITAVMNKYN